jgi:hypothetical protein
MTNRHPHTDVRPHSHTPALYSLSEPDKVKMLRKLMLYWDGQWFLRAVEDLGLDAAIDLNARVRASFGRIEMRTLLKTLSKRQAQDLPDAVRLLETYGEAFMGGGLRAEFVTLDVDHAEVIVRRCAAFEGAKRAALPRADQACIACERLWQVWLETLLPGIEVVVQYPMRQGKGDPYCRFLIRTSQTESAELPPGP